MRPGLLLAIALTIPAAATVGGCGDSSSTASGGRAAADTGVRTCTELFAGGAKGAAKNACVWKKHELKVRFLEGERAVQERVQKHAKTWTAHSGVTFTFTDDADADIRIAFDKNDGSWSYVGLCQGDVPKDKATMNFGWLTPTTDDAEYQRVVLHEFGHALGLVHEHQHPAAKIAWNEPVVLAYYRRTQGWDEETTRHNVFEKYAADQLRQAEYDRDSIMHYPIPKEFTTDGTEVGWNRALSEKDKEFIAKVYGR
jgi:hypothetical protein